MDLNKFFNTGKKKRTFKAAIKEKTKKGMKILKFFVYAYTQEEAMKEAAKRLEEDHPDMDSRKITIEEQ